MRTLSLFILGIALLFVFGGAEATDPTWVAEDISTNADDAYSVFAADLDNDGDMDIISASTFDDKIAWYVNDGNENPSWTTSIITIDADGARSVFAADMDGDGDLDIVSASTWDDTIAWYENSGGATPTFTASNIATNADGAEHVFVADMDDDGDMDILSAEYGDDTIAWYENNGAANPSWSASNIATNADGANCVFAADMDNDGDLDIISASRNDNTIAWYENDGNANPSWSASDIYTEAEGAESVFAADMDNDGDMDIVSVTYQGSTLAWYENDGAEDPSWTVSTIAGDVSYGKGVFVEDIDNDGDMDIVTASLVEDKIALYVNDGASDPTWAGSTIATSADGAIDVFVADMDNDGDMDVLSASNEDDAIAWYENTADFTFEPWWTASDIATSVDGVQSVFAADMDNDGDMDILSASRHDDTIAWYENNNGDGSSWTAADIDTNADGAYSVFAADMDGDGDLDIISASENDDTIAWYVNDGNENPSWTTSIITIDADGARSVFAADMDGDGDLDIVSASTWDDTIAWYENSGGATPTFTASNIATNADGAEHVFVADMDDDGDMDILSAEYGDDTIAWYENNGAANPSWSASNIATNADGANCVFAADMDNDGDLDIISASRNDNTIAWYENDGNANPSWSASDIYTEAEGAESVFAADMDNDGDMDIVSVTYQGSTLAWYENDGAEDPSWTVSTIAGDVSYGKGVFVEDIDNDGDMDIISASVSDDTIAWYENDAGEKPPVLVDYNVNPSPALYGEEVYFYSNFSDADGYIVQHNWESDIDGFLSNHGNFSADDLSAGLHNIKFRAKDDDGVWSAYETFIMNIDVPFIVSDWDTGAPDRYSLTSNFMLYQNPSYVANGGCYELAKASLGEWSLVNLADGWMMDGYGYGNSVYNSSLDVSGDTLYKSVLVECNTNSDNVWYLPVVNSLTITPNPTHLGERVYFSANYSDYDGDVVEFEWSSDIDGFLSDTAEFSTDTLSAGTHTIELRVKDDDGGWSDTAEEILEIMEPPNEGPIINSILIDPNPADYIDMIHFSADYSDSDGEVVDFEWSSDIDGIISLENSFTSDQLTSGTHIISLKVWDNDGDWSSMNTTLFIQPFVPNEIIDFCLIDSNGACLSTDNKDITFEASKLQTVSVDFLVENKGNIDVEVAFAITRPDGTTGTGTYTDKNQEEWRLSIAPSDTEIYLQKIAIGESLDWGGIGIIAMKVQPGTYLFTLDIMSATEADDGSYAFETVGQLTITVVVEGEEPIDELPTENEKSTGILPGFSMIAAIIAMAVIVLRKRD